MPQLPSEPCEHNVKQIIIFDSRLKLKPTIADPLFEYNVIQCQSKKFPLSQSVN